MSAEAHDPLVLARRDRAITHLTLNRPRALNALNIEMFEALLRGLEAAVGSSAIVLDGAGERGFCGGGDVKAIAAHPEPRELFGLEYRLDYAVHTSPVPVVALMDGITMGGGIGLGGHARYRVVTEQSRLAMPEVRIGIAPDVGGHLLLARAPGYLGEYLAITAGEMSGADAVALGFADTYVRSDQLAALREALAAGATPEEALTSYSEEAPDASLLAVREWFDAIAEESLRDVAADPAAATLRLVEALETAGAGNEPHAEGARRTAETMRGMCPVSLAVTLAQISRTRAERLTLDAVLEDDYRIVPRLAIDGNFAEGVRAQLIDKDRNPKWEPRTVEALDPAALARLLAPHPAGVSGLGLNERGANERGASERGASAD